MRIRSVVGAAVLGLVVMGCSEGNVFSLEPGTCFDDVTELTSEGGGEVSDVPVVDCGEPHDNEVFATFDLEGDDFPGQDAVVSQADAGCVDRFEAYVGRDYPSSRFVSSHLVPTQQTWEDQGDREVVCFLYDIDLARLEGSAEGSGE